MGVPLAPRRLSAGPTVTGTGGGREQQSREPPAPPGEGEVGLRSLPLADRALGLQTRRRGPGALLGPVRAPLPLPRLAAMRGRWRGLSRGRRPPFARNPCGLRPPPPLQAGPARSTPSAAPPPPDWGERGRSHLLSSPLPWRSPSPGHCCDGNWGSCQGRLGVWEPLLIGFMCESPPAQPSVSLNTPPGPAPAPLDLPPSP